MLIIYVVNSNGGNDIDRQSDIDIADSWCVTRVTHIHALAIVDGHDNCDNGGA